MIKRDASHLAVLAAVLSGVTLVGVVGCNSSATTGGAGTAVPSAKEAVGETNGAATAGEKIADGVVEKVDGDKQASAAESSQGGRQTDNLLLSYSNDPDTLNVVNSNDTTSQAFQRWVYEGLADRNFSNPDEWDKVLAEDWEFDEKNLEYTIHLRKGVKWHPMTLPDGTPLPDEEFDADDVKFTFDCILNPGTEAASMRSYYEDPEAKDDSERYKIKVEVVDDHTVKIRWTKPYFMADEFTLAVPILPEHVYSVNERGEPISFDYASKEFADGFNKHWANTKMCGTGPVIFKDWVKSERVELERNPAYWGEKFPFSRVVFYAIANPNTALQKMLQNELDWNPISEKELYVQSQENPNVKAGKVVLDAYDYPGYRYVGYNQQRDFFRDKLVRQAMSHTVPIDEIIDKVYHGLASRLTGPFQPGSSATDESLAPIPFDLDKARALLEEAGWKDSNGNGTRDKMVEGSPVEAKFDLMIYADSPQYLTIATIIKENCRKVGVDVIITPAKWALMLQKLRKKEFDACILGWAMGWKQDPYQIWHSSQADLQESSNSIGYKNADVDKLIEELRVTMDPDKQIELYHKIHGILYDEQPYTFLFADKATAGHDARLQNIEFYKIRPCYDVREWRSKQPRM